ACLRDGVDGGARTHDLLAGLVGEHDGTTADGDVLEIEQREWTTDEDRLRHEARISPGLTGGQQRERVLRPQSSVVSTRREREDLEGSSSHAGAMGHQRGIAED